MTKLAPYPRESNVYLFVAESNGVVYLRTSATTAKDRDEKLQRFKDKNNNEKYTTFHPFYVDVLFQRLIQKPDMNKTHTDTKTGHEQDTYDANETPE